MTVGFKFKIMHTLPDKKFRICMLLMLLLNYNLVNE